MNKLVVIELEKGNLNDGFPSVTVRFWDRNSRPTQFHASLPPAPEIAELYRRFQLIYEALYQRVIKRSLIEVDGVGLTNISEVDFNDIQQELAQAINSWLNSNSFRPIDQQLRARLALNEEFQVIFETSDRRLRYLPWHLWNFIEDYRLCEIGLSYPSYEPIKPSSHNTTDKVRILAILGSSDGINIQEDKIVLEQLPNSSTSFLVEPSRQELDDQLWEKQGWDILFFAGHSHSQSQNGQIQINQNSSLTITELRNALKYAITRGLKLAIFNSCDGLGLAQELADLQIPQIIVMRHDIPDLVAQEFLKHFLKAFAFGQSFYLAVRYARERLQGLEDRFPGASWLPVICQNPAEDPPTWQTLRGQAHAIPFQLVRQKLQTVLLMSVVMTGLVMGVRSLGWMQQWELPVFDSMMRMRPAEVPDPRIVVINITEADIRAQNQKQKRSLSDRALDRVLQKLAPSKPRVIGLDIYRDFPADSQYPNLAVSLKNNDFIAICKAGEDDISPPPEVPNKHIGFSDIVRDDDLIVRRHLLDMNPSAQSSCITRRSFSLQIARQYLENQGILSEITPDKYYQIGSVVFKPLKSPTGSYQKFDDLGHQILLNYRSGGKVAEEITLGQVLQGKFNPNLFKDKVVIIGTDALSTRDYFLTPYSQGTTPHKEVPGVLIQTEMVSQILSAVLDKRPLLWFLPVWGEAIWIWAWSVIAGIVALYSSKRLQFALFVSAILLVLYGCCFVLLLLGACVPFVPPVLALVATGFARIFLLKDND